MKLKTVNPRWKSCGQNADWVLGAHTFGTVAPNMHDGEFYVLEGEEPGLGEAPFMVMRSYPSQDEDEKRVRHLEDFETLLEAREYVERAWWSRLYTLTVGYCPFSEASLHELAIEAVRRSLIDFVDQENFDARA